MKEVLVDSCVFFSMLNYFENVDDINSLPKIVEDDKRFLKNLRNEIISLFDDETKLKIANEIDSVKDKYKYYENIIKGYKNHITQKVSTLTRKIENAERLSKKKVFVKFSEIEKHPKATILEYIYEDNNTAIKGCYVYEPNIKDSTASQNLKNIPVFENELNKLVKWEQIKEKIAEYIALSNTIATAPLFEKIFKKEIKPYITDAIAHEIVAHTEKRPDNEEWLCFEKSLVDSFIETYISRITINSRELINTANNLATKLRTKSETKPLKEMHINDVNSVGVYGDSLIMAYAILTGYNLITLNGKDFIFDKGKASGNDFIRQYIDKVAKENGFNSGALAYSVEELLNTELPETIKDNINFKTIDYTKNKHTEKFTSTNFQDLYEM